MENSGQKENDRSATEWLTRPLYKILILGLVILELLGKEMDGGMRQFVHIILWIAFVLVVIINVVNIFLFFGSKRNSSKKTL